MMRTWKSINFLGGAIFEGQSYLGTARAASEMRELGLIDFIKNLGTHVFDHGDAPHRHCQKNVYRSLYESCLNMHTEERLSLIIGGDHSQSIGTISALLNKNPDLGIIWIDAHGDINTPETSLTGQLHGMPLAVLLGLTKKDEFPEFSFAWGCLKPEQLVYLGVRDLDLGEAEIIEKLKIPVYTNDDISNNGLPLILEKALDHLSGREIHVSFDIDAVDPKLAPSTGVPVDDGLTLADIIYLGQRLADTNRVQSIEIVELNPDLCYGDLGWRRTAQIVFSFLNAFFNKQNLRQGQHSYQLGHKELFG